MLIARYFHTVRHLKWSQIYWRLFYKFIKVAPELAAPPKLREPLYKWEQITSKPSSYKNDQEFCFLNETHRVQLASDWNNPEYEKLWLYNLHYFDDLNAASAKTRIAHHKRLIDRWVDENPPGFGNGWEPYPLSLRICNWIKWGLSGNPMKDTWQHSLAVQVRFLNKKIEWHILGNHLFTNAKALIFAGMFFDGDEAKEWLDTGLSIIDNELDEQILSDGGHFELSPMYHSIILEDILDLINLYQKYNKKVPIKWRDKAEHMLEWMAIMTHPDGQIVLFNDAAFGIASSPEELITYASEMEIPIANCSDKQILKLSDTGYVRVKKGLCTGYLDVAQIGPDYIPGHAHADSLNFELSIGEQRVFVDSGTSEYGISEERGRQRSTRAHNTVCIDQENSSEVWGGFRVARRAKVYDVNIKENDKGLLICAKHDGYYRLKGKPTHKRCWQFSNNTLTISDILTGSGDHTAEINWHIHPNLKVVKSEHILSILDDNECEICRMEIDPQLSVSLCSSTYHPQFGMQIDNVKILCNYEGVFPVTLVNTVFWKCAPNNQSLEGTIN